MLFVVLVMLMFVVNLCPKADQPHQEDRCWSQCLLTEQWCLLAHLHFKVDLYRLTIRLCQHHCLGCYVQNCVFNGLGAGLCQPV